MLTACVVACPRFFSGGPKLHAILREGHGGLRDPKICRSFIRGWSIFRSLAYPFDPARSTFAAHSLRR